MFGARSRVFRKVFLGSKKSYPKKLFAIKVMRKSDMIKKNMISHGKSWL